MPTTRASGVPLGVGFVGCGFATHNRHLPGLRRVSGLRVAALADVDSAMLARVADGAGVARRYSSAAGLVADPEVDVVAVCVPAAHHVEVALTALDAGKHVLVEKPLALTLDDADRLIAAAELSPAKAIVGFNLRWHRLVRQAAELVRGGAIGSVEAIRTVFNDAILDRSDLPAWRVRREQGGGALLDKAVHHVDLWRLLLDDEVEELFAFGRSKLADDQTVAIAARTHGGVICEALVSDRTATNNELTLFGQSGAIHLDLYRSDGLRLVGSHELPGALGSRVRQLRDSVGQMAANIGEIRRGGVFDATYGAEWRAFAEAIRLDVQPQPTLDDGRRALEISLAAAESISTGKPVRIAASPAGGGGTPPVAAT